MSNSTRPSISDVATVLMGQSPLSASCSEECHGLPFIQGNAEFGKRYPSPVLRCSAPTRIAEPGDMLLSVRAPVGEVNQANSRIVIGRGLSAVRFEHEDQAFAWHALRWIASSLNRVAQGSTFVAVSRRDVESLALPWPTSWERSGIAEILDRMDATIERTEAVITKLMQIRAGLLRDLFTYGCDDRGELRSDEDDPRQWRMTTLGWLPRSWDVVSLGTVAEKIQDGTHFSPSSRSGPRRYITSKNVRFGFLSLEDCGWITESEHRAIYQRCDVRANDVLLTKDGANTGNAALNTLNEEFSLLSSVAFIRCSDGRTSPRFVLHYILSANGQKRLKDLMSGNAITRLTLQKIRAFTIPHPPFSEQEAIADRLDCCTRQIVEEERQLRKYRGLKVALMNDLLSGRVRVPHGSHLAEATA